MELTGRRMQFLLFTTIIAALAVQISADVDVKSFDYDAATLQSSLESGAHFVLLYSGHGGCKECESAREIVQELMGTYNDQEKRDVTIAELDCSKNDELCKKLGADSYPTFFYLQGEQWVRYIGDVKKDDLVAFITEQGLANVEAVVMNNGLYEPTESNFKGFVAKGNHFVKFYAPWCGHCKKLAPTWDTLAKEFENSNDVKISKIDCTAHKPVCSDFGVRGYPTLKFISEGKETKAYSGNRGLEALRNFVNEEVAKEPEEEEEEDKTKRAAEEDEEVEEEIPGKKHVVELNDKNFGEVIGAKDTFVKFYAPWCGHCKRLAPIWEELAESVAKEEVVIAKLDCTEYGTLCNEHEVEGYPTLKFFKAGKSEGEYEEEQNLRELQEYLVQEGIHIEGVGEGEHTENNDGEHIEDEDGTANPDHDGEDDGGWDHDEEDEEGEEDWDEEEEKEAKKQAEKKGTHDKDEL